ncbi:unnamed protein product [Haemonchus placei]|uniref:Neur_chan_LBD domain-containing protein n=1 Tax=Haemonchus placei TaxID=6290 RepID=A0A0N4VWA0_HAEPC|nr:unnamed protein product [Haemonchus placei]
MSEYNWNPYLDEIMHATIIDFQLFSMAAAFRRKVIRFGRYELSYTPLIERA